MKEMYRKGIVLLLCVGIAFSSVGIIFANEDNVDNQNVENQEEITQEVETETPEEPKEDTKESPKQNVLKKTPKVINVCEIDGTKYPGLDAALEKIADSESKTIKLLDNITYEDTISVSDGKKITFDLNGHNLTISTGGKVCLSVGANSKVDYKGTGNFNLKTESDGGASSRYALEVTGNDAKATVTNVSGKSRYNGLVQVRENGAAVIKGDVSYECTGGDLSNAEVVYVAGGSADIKGNITVTNENARLTGIHVLRGTAEVGGNVKVTDNGTRRDTTAVCSRGSEVTVKRNVILEITNKEEENLSTDIGVSVGCSGKANRGYVTVDGQIKSDGTYIKFNDSYNKKAITDYDETSLKKGYVQYSEILRIQMSLDDLNLDEGKNYVWVKNEDDTKVQEKEPEEKEPEEKEPEEKEPKDKKPKDKKDPDGAKTGDENNMIVWLALMGLAVTGIGFGIKQSKKSN